MQGEGGSAGQWSNWSGLLRPSSRRQSCFGSVNGTHVYLSLTHTHVSHRHVSNTNTHVVSLSHTRLTHTRLSLTHTHVSFSHIHVSHTNSSMNAVIHTHMHV